MNLGGPVTMTFRELMKLMLDVIRRRRLVLNIPFFAAKIMAFGFDMLADCHAGSGEERYGHPRSGQESCATIMLWQKMRRVLMTWYRAHSDGFCVA